MNKHEALLSLEKAHKLRKHADKLERRAYEILDEKKDHEVKASDIKSMLRHGYVSNPSPKRKALSDGHTLSRIAATHSQLSDFHDHGAANSTGERSAKHAELSRHHDHESQKHYRKANAILKPHFDAKERNAIHKDAAVKTERQYGNALESPEWFAHDTARLHMRNAAKG